MQERTTPRSKVSQGDLPLEDAGATQHSPERRFRSELAWAFGAFQVCVTALAAATELTLGTPALGVMYLVTLALLGLLLVWLWRGGPSLTIGNLLVTVVFLAVTVTNVITGGASIGANIALPTLVLVAVMYSPAPMAWAWTGLAIAQIAFVSWLRGSGLTFPVQPDPVWVSSAVDRVPLFFSVGAAVIGAMIMRALDRYRDDFTASQRAETEAKALAASSAERFTDFAEIAADGFWETDDTLRLCYVSRQFAEYMGLEAADMLGLTPGEAYQLRFPGQLDYQQFMTPLDRRESFSDLVFPAMDRVGVVRWMRCLGRPCYDARGEFNGYRGAFRDITQQRRDQRRIKRSEERLRLITENIPAMIAYYDAETRYQFCNEQVCRVLGLAREEILGRRLSEVRGEEIFQGLHQHVPQVLAGKRVVFDGEGDWRDRHWYFQTHYIPDLDDKGAVKGFYAAIFDISAIRRSEIALKDASTRITLITDNVPAHIYHIDQDRRFTFANASAVSELAAQDGGGLIGHTLEEVLSEEVCHASREHVEAALKGESVTYELESAGRFFRATFVPDNNERGTTVGFYALITDVTPMKRVEIELRHMAQFDTLTGLPNRRQFNDKINEAMARSRRTGTLLGLMFLDLDRFKSINDTYGHEVGDKVLKEFATRVKSAVRQTDTVCRLAGDEFVVILEHLASPEDARLVAAKIQRSMELELELESVSVGLSTTIGIALYSEEDADGEALLRRADSALYRAKDHQRGSYAFAEIRPAVAS